jgi:hypothetical protein
MKNLKRIIFFASYSGNTYTGVPFFCCAQTNIYLNVYLLCLTWKPFEPRFFSMSIIHYIFQIYTNNIANMTPIFAIPIQVRSVIHTPAIHYVSDHQYSVREVKR